MEMIAEQIGFTFALALAVFVGSYFGVFRRNKTKLPVKDLLGLFFLLWLISAVLFFLFIFSALLSGLDQAAMPEGIYLLGPLIFGILIGRKLVSWRRKIHAGNTEPDAEQES